MPRRLKHGAIAFANHAPLRNHLNDFMLAYNFAKRLKTLKGLTPYEYICKSGQQSQSDSSSTRPIRCRD
jgi:hypothetical protein